MKYLKYFEQASAYEAYKNGSDYILPNVSYIVETENVSFEPYVELPISLCDIAYWDGSKVKTVSQDKWDASLGTPMGVVVIPEGVVPDGKARIVSLQYCTTEGTQTTSPTSMVWSPSSGSKDTILTNYTVVPTTDNAGSTSTGSAGTGYLPSDKFTGPESYVDPGMQYSGTDGVMTPSPYLGNDKTFNPEYSKELSGNNVMSDFNGASNTEVLVGISAGYTAANAAHNYNGGVDGTGIQWYLPAMGELGFLMSRFNAINAAITAVGGVAVSGSDYFWSSSEHSTNYAYRVDTNNGYIGYYGKYYTTYVRPFAIID